MVCKWANPHSKNKMADSNLAFESLCESGTSKRRSTEVPPKPNNAGFVVALAAIGVELLCRRAAWRTRVVTPFSGWPLVRTRLRTARLWPQLGCARWALADCTRCTARLLLLSQRNRRRRQRAYTAFPWTRLRIVMSTSTQHQSVTFVHWMCFVFYFI